MFPLRDTITYHGAKIATYGIIFTSVLAFFLQFTGGFAGFAQSFYTHGFVPVQFFADPWHEFSTIFTSMFMHGSLSHLFINLWFLWVFGPAVEGRLGFIRFMVLYLLSGVAAAFLHGFSVPHSLVPMVGASGAVSGILGAYLVLFSRARVLTVIPPFILFPFWVPAPIYIGIWIILQFIQALFEVEGVAWWAHIGGFVLGLVLILIMRPKRHYRADPFWECWRDYC